MYVDFSVAFHLVLMLNFVDVFIIRVVAQRGKYLVDEPKLDI